MNERPEHRAPTIAPRSRRQGGLTAALILLLLVHPLLEGSRTGSLVFVMVSNLIVLAGLYAVSWNNRRLAVGLLFAIPSVVTSWSFFFQRSFAIGVTEIVWILLFFVYTLVTIMQRILRSQHIGTDELFGGLNVYILIGVSWGLLYFLVEACMPGSFSLGELPRGTATFIYFSFSTLGTLGLGDVRPVLPLARSLTVIEMLIGLFFIAVLFARLVAVFRVEGGASESKVGSRVPFEQTVRMVARLPRWSLVMWIAVANLATSIADDRLQMPLFLDTWATSAGVFCCGFWVGAAGGILYNLVMAAVWWGTESWVWAFSSLLVAALSAVFWRQRWIDITRPISLIGCGLCLGFASAALGMVTLRLSGLPRNTSTLEIHTMMLSVSDSVFLADIVQQIVTESMDKVVSLTIAALVMFAVTELRKPGGVEE